MVNRLNAVTILQYILMWKYDIGHLKPKLMLYLNYTSVKKKKIFKYRICSFQKGALDLRLAVTMH